MRRIERTVHGHVDLPKKHGQKPSFMLQLSCGHAVQLHATEKLNWPVGCPAMCLACSTDTETH